MVTFGNLFSLWPAGFGSYTGCWWLWASPLTCLALSFLSWERGIVPASFNLRTSVQEQQDSRAGMRPFSSCLAAYLLLGVVEQHTCFTPERLPGLDLELRLPFSHGSFERNLEKVCARLQGQSFLGVQTVVQTLAFFCGCLDSSTQTWSKFFLNLHTMILAVFPFQKLSCSCSFASRGGLLIFLWSKAVSLCPWKCIKISFPTVNI